MMVPGDEDWLMRSRTPCGTVNLKTISSGTVLLMLNLANILQIEPDFPFPVEVPPQIRADLHKLGGVLDGKLEHGHFKLDRQYETYLERKRGLLRTHPERCRCIQTDDEPGLRQALERVNALIESEHPNLAENTSSHSRETLETFADAVACRVQEDIVIVRGTDQAQAELLHVCFPSRWNPRQKIGQSFAAIHEPVADNAQLIAASRNVAHAMIHKGPFVRFVWALTTDARLDQHPDNLKLEPDQALLNDPERLAASTFFRTERQTTYPMPDLDRALFTIRVYVQPLTDAVQDRSKRARLAAALKIMSPALAAYKGYARLREPLLAWLEDGIRG